MPLLLALLACQDYSLNGDGAHGGKYNPPVLDSEVREDRVTQVPIPAVDVLWVIDNSCSMEEEQAALRTNFGAFIRYFTDSGMDYHVGVVSTDMESRAQSGKLIRDGTSGSRFIDTSYSSEEAVASFRARATLGTDGSSDERGKDAVFTALTTEADRTNLDFYREEAALSVVVISDEVDYSRITLEEFVSWMLGMKTDPGMVSFSSIVGPAGGCPTAEEGIGYREVTEAVGGIEWSICTSDWASLLTELGLQAAGLKREFFLSLVPVQDSIEVSVVPPGGGTPTGFEAETDWTYSRARNSITFRSFVPDPLAEVRMRYTVLASEQIPAEEAPER